MRTHWLLGVLIVIAVGGLLVGDAMAQIPPHSPGTICFTRFFWCWAQPPGPAGTICGCPSPQGWVQGIRG
jgi:hypothetical protein